MLCTTYNQVRHTHWGYRAVVVGWDLFAKAHGKSAMQRHLHACLVQRSSQLQAFAVNSPSRWREVPESWVTQNSWAGYDSKGDRAACSSARLQLRAEGPFPEWSGLRPTIRISWAAA